MRRDHIICVSDPAGGELRDEQFGPCRGYKAQGYLTTSPQAYLGEIPFEIVVRT